MVGWMLRVIIRDGSGEVRGMREAGEGREMKKGEEAR
jgi:hypothetical protein